MLSFLTDLTLQIVQVCQKKKMNKEFPTYANYNTAHEPILNIRVQASPNNASNGCRGSRDKTLNVKLAVC